MDLAQAAHAGGVTLLGTALALGVRHGIDWDHIAAITDIAGTTTSIESERDDAGPARARPRIEFRAVWLASLYALGHALVVVLLGLAALQFGALLPDWIDPIMERVVGATLLILGAWILYSLIVYWRGEGEFRMRSRWMLLFEVIRRGWHGFQHRLGAQHVHHHDVRLDQCGPRTAFGVGLIHGVGAETGSQVLIIAAVGGAASQGLGVAMMFAFVVGLLISNTAIALLSATGFVSSARARSVYVAAGCLAGVFSLFVGTYFVLGLGDQLADLYRLTSFLGVDAE